MEFFNVEMNCESMAVVWNFKKKKNAKQFAQMTGGTVSKISKDQRVDGKKWSVEY